MAVEIEWIDSESAKSTGNKIYRDTVPSTGQVEIADIANGNQIYQDDTAEVGTGVEYKYVIQAHDGAGDETTQEVEGENMDFITTAASGPDYSIENATYDSIMSPVYTSLRAFDVSNSRVFLLDGSGGGEEFTFNDADCSLWAPNGNSDTGMLTSFNHWKWNGDGSKAVFLSNNDKRVFSYEYGTPYVLSTRGTRDIKDDLAEITSSTRSMYLKPDGLKIYCSDYGTGIVYQYSMSPANDILSIVYDSISLDCSAQVTDPYAMCISPDGKKLLIGGYSASIIYEFDLPTPWVLTGGTYSGNSIDVSASAENPCSIRYNEAGDKFWVSGVANSRVYQYSLNN